MKKVLAALLICPIILCTGCGAKKQTTALLNDISVMARVRYKNEGYYCGICRKNNEFTLTVYSPAELKGLKYCSKNGKSRFEFNGLSHETENCGFAADIKSAFDMLDNKPAVKSGENFSAQAGKGKKKYILTVNEKGKPQKLICDYAGLTADFK